MKLNQFLLGVLIVVSLNSQAQKSAVWKDFKNAKKTGKEAILPDFSYAGYKYSEVPIPTVGYKIFDITEFGAIANDKISDKNAIRKAIAAATRYGEGIIFSQKVNI